MVVVLDDLFGLPGTLDAVGVLEGKQCAPSDALGRPHHPLESPTVAGGTVSVPVFNIVVEEFYIMVANASSVANIKLG